MKRYAFYLFWLFLLAFRTFTRQLVGNHDQSKMLPQRNPWLVTLFPVHSALRSSPAPGSKVNLTRGCRRPSTNNDAIIQLYARLSATDN